MRRDAGRELRMRTMPQLWRFMIMMNGQQQASQGRRGGAGREGSLSGEVRHGAFARLNATGSGQGPRPGPVRVLQGVANDFRLQDNSVARRACRILPKSGKTHRSTPQKNIRPTDYFPPPCRSRELSKSAAWRGKSQLAGCYCEVSRCGASCTSLSLPTSAFQLTPQPSW